MTLEPGRTLLNERLRLISRMRAVEGQTADVWLAYDTETDLKCFVKAWPARSRESEQGIRGLWDAELRTLYRLASSPHAEDYLVRLTYAEFDRTLHQFLMVLSTTSTTPLAELLDRNRRGRIGWLDVREIETRRHLWSGLRIIADGIRLLHRQNVLHRSVDAATIYCDQEVGPSSFRLGGFEWSIRVGVPADRNALPRNGWLFRPEEKERQYARLGHGPESDWFGFGMLAARVLVPGVEILGEWSPDERYEKVLARVRDAQVTNLSETEREFLLGLIDPDPRRRFNTEASVTRGLDEIITMLVEGRTTVADRRKLVLVLNPNKKALSREVFQELQARQLLPSGTSREWEEDDRVQQVAVETVLNTAFADSKLYPSPRGYGFVLAGDCISVQIRQFEMEPGAAEGRETTWDAADIVGIAHLKHYDRRISPTVLPPGSVYVTNARTARTDRDLQAGSRSWEHFLPRVDPLRDLGPSMERFYDFIRGTNQLELLIRTAEIFPFEVVASEIDADGQPRVTIREIPRDPPLPKWCAPKTLHDWIAEQDDFDPDESIACFLYGRQDDPFRWLGKDSEAGRTWLISDEPTEDHAVVLKPEQLHLDTAPDGGERPRRAIASTPFAVGDRGLLRPKNLNGQLELLRRRKEAIGRIRDHTYLLQALTKPRSVWIDTGAVADPSFLPTERLSRDKRDVIEDVLRGRPIYVLQGPPGTGKSTLVAELVRCILREDPVAQILIAAPMHEAVDLLLAKVRDEAFRGESGRKRPLTIRFPRPASRRIEHVAAEAHAHATKPAVPRQDEPGSKGHTAQEEIRTALQALEHLRAESPLSPLQKDWITVLREMQASATAETKSTDLTNFEALVALGANLTYCTTTSGDLATLAKSEQTFDWTIIEEAAKSHGFDLALPLQAGHRWLLIGDQFQIRPYFFEQYRDALNDMDLAVDLLASLPRGASGYRDDDWLTDWQTRTPEDRQEFAQYAARQLPTFEALFEHTKGVRARFTEPGQVLGAAAGQLSVQHRMHPVIGELVSKVFYEPHGLRLASPDAHELPERDALLRHPLRLPNGRALPPLVWLDAPRPDDASFTRDNEVEVQLIDQLLHTLRVAPDYEIQGDAPEHRKLELALLTPYRRQRKLLSDHFEHKGGRLPDWIEPRPRARDLNRRGASQRTHGPAGHTARRALPAHTVDSFQGNQSRIVIVSLSRNTKATSATELTHLNRYRTNVLVSRAQAMLVLVGGLEFFRRQVASIRPDDLGRSDSHWRRLLDCFDSMTGDGRAMLLTSRDLDGGAR